MGGILQMMSRRRLAAGAAVTLSLAMLLSGSSAVRATTAGTSSNFQLVGHASLYDRGMNSAPAIYGNYMYIGSRTDGSHLHSGVQIVDISDPTTPQDVGEIPLPPDLSLGYTSRELRVWPDQNLLMVMYFGCSALIHACVSAQDTGLQPLQRINFFDVEGTNGASPLLVSTYKPSTTPHEMFLWIDSVHSGRALLYWTSPNNSGKQLVVTDISQWRSGQFPEVTTFTAVPSFSTADRSNYDVRLHSLSVSPDGTRTYLAYLGGGVLILDSSDLANAVANPQLRLLTPIAGRAYWDYEGAHSSVKIPGKPYILTTEEIYGKGGPDTVLFGPALGGCPWGWVRIVDMTDPTHLVVRSEYRIDENQPGFCANVSALQDNYSSYTSHNPTVLPDLALVTWHSGGLQAIDLTDPTDPAQDGFFLPTPEPDQPNHTADPALEPGSNGVIAWSYPIIRNGLIYFIDIKNGLYIVRYTGPHAAEVAGITFLEGNSNRGDAMTLGG